MSGGIYKITNTRNGKIYVGSSFRLEYRIREHIRSLKRGAHENPRLQNAFNKYGEGSFVFEVVEHVEDSALLLSTEQNWIDRLGSTDRRAGYNICLTAGSPRGTKHTPEARAKMSAAQQRRAPATAETRAKISASLRGKPKSKEAVERHRAAITGRVPTAEERAKVSAFFKGRPRSREAVARTAAGHLGKTRSAEARAKMSAAQYSRQARERAERAASIP